MSEPVFVREDETSVFLRELDRPYPLIDRAEGVWLYDQAGTAYLDAVGGGAMVTSRRPRRPGARRGGARAGRAGLLPLQPAVHDPAPGGAGARAARARTGGLHPRPLRDGRRRGERDRGAPGPQLPRRARRARPLADRLPGPGLPRPDRRHALAHRAAGPAPPLRAVPRPAPAHPALDLALRPQRRGGARGARPGARGGRPGDRLRVLLRARQRGRAARLLPAGAFLGRARRTSRRAWLPRLPRRGGHRHGANGDVVRRRAAPVRAGRDHDRQGARRRLRADRGGALPRRGLPGDRRRVTRVRARAHLGRRAASLRRRPRRHPLPAGPRARRAGARRRPAAPRGATGRPGRLRARRRGTRPRLPPGHRLRRPARRAVVPAARARRRAADRRRGPRPRPRRLLDPADRDGYAGDQTLVAPAFTSTDEELSLVVERMAETVRAVEREALAELASDTAVGRAR